LIGFLTVFGIAVRNGVVLLRRLQRLERDDGEEFGPGMVLRGARERFAPTLLTALATGLFFLPFAAFGDLPGLEILNPMGGVIVGGLVTSTVLTLFLLPALYLRFGQGQADVEELDLRDLWEVRLPGTSPAVVSTNGDGVPAGLLTNGPGEPAVVSTDGDGDLVTAP